FQSADRVLDLALDLVGFAFGLHLLIAERLAGGLLHLALGLFGRAFNAVFVHDGLRLRPAIECRESVDVPCSSKSAQALCPCLQSRLVPAACALFLAWVPTRMPLKIMTEIGRQA